MPRMICNFGGRDAVRRYVHMYMVRVFISFGIWIWKIWKFAEIKKEMGREGGRERYPRYRDGLRYHPSENWSDGRWRFFFSSFWGGGGFSLGFKMHATFPSSFRWERNVFIVPRSVW